MAGENAIHLYLMKSKLHPSSPMFAGRQPARRSFVHYLALSESCQKQLDQGVGEIEQDDEEIEVFHDHNLLWRHGFVGPYRGLAHQLLAMFFLLGIKNGPLGAINSPRISRVLLWSKVAVAVNNNCIRSVSDFQTLFFQS